VSKSAASNRPIFKPREVKAADSVFWYVEAEWSDGTIEEIGQFSSVLEAWDWIAAIRGNGLVSGPGMRGSRRQCRRLATAGLAWAVVFAAIAMLWAWVVG
jgi:hypothetical protein